MTNLTTVSEDNLPVLIRWSSTISLEMPADWLPHQRRVVFEHNDLHDKLTKLEKFLNPAPRSILPEAEFLLMVVQASMMRGYRDVLRARMQLWGLKGVAQG